MKKHSHFPRTFITGISAISLSGLAQAVPRDLLESLGNEDYQKREAAEQKLSQWTKDKGKETFNELKKIKDAAESPEVKHRLDNVLDKMNVYEPIPGTRGYIGIMMGPVMGGARINAVQPGTPAEKHGLEPGDIIHKLDDVDLTEKNTNIDDAMNFLRAYVKKKNSGDKLTLKLMRDGKELTKELKLGDYDKEVDPFGAPRNGQLPQIRPNVEDLLDDPFVGPRLQLRLNGGLGADELQNQLNQQLQQQLEQQFRRDDALRQQLNKAELKNLQELLELQQKANEQRLKLMKEQLNDILPKDKQPKAPVIPERE